MPYRPISGFLQKLEDRYNAADYDAIAACYVFPGAIFAGEKVIVLEDRDGLREMLRDHCERTYLQGVRRVRARLVCTSLNRSEDYSAWVHWEQLDGSGARVEAYNERYLCQDGPDGTPKIRLVELFDVPTCYMQTEMYKKAIDRRRG